MPIDRQRWTRSVARAVSQPTDLPTRAGRDACEWGARGTRRLKPRPPIPGAARHEEISSDVRPVHLTNRALRGVVERIGGGTRAERPGGDARVQPVRERRYDRGVPEGARLQLPQLAGQR